ncbi:MAG: hypothetical protein V4519_03100 [Patescibacteria group bacterium]
MKLFTSTKSALLILALFVSVVSPVVVKSAEFSSEAQRFSDISQHIVVIQNTTQELESQLKSFIEKSVSDHIYVISKLPQNQTRSIESLNSYVNPLRLELIENIYTQLSHTDTLTATVLKDLEAEVLVTLDAMHKGLSELANESDYFGNYSADIKTEITKASQAITLARDALSKNQGDLVFKDSDSDTLSDFDEVHVFKTDPSIFTSQIIPSQYQDPHTAGITASNIFEVRNISYVASSSTDSKSIVVEGTALPNSTLTLFIYSNPIIASVKANAQGLWKYIVTDPLEDGNHTLYIASVNGEGTIVSKSEPTSFSKTPKSIVLETVGLTQDVLEARKDKLQKNIIPLLVGVLAIAGLFIGVVYRMLKNNFLPPISH